MDDDVPATAPRRPARPAARPVPTLRPAAPPVVRRGHLPLGEPAGAADRVEVTSGWLERGGRPWFPVTGEVHYSRTPRERWDEVLGHARAGGLDSVATYVLWQAHEPEPGRFRWDGDLDLRAFVQLAGEHGLDVVVRLGPWAHGEARHGGFPDWLVQRRLRTRTDDPAYLELVRRLYAETVTQLKGLTHAEGGPVVGAQVDNELYDQPQHLATLRRTAEELGLRVPLWTATGWGGAQVPDTLLPLYSAYSDGFWEESTTGWPPFAASHFRYAPVRDDLTVGADLREALDGVAVDPAAVRLKDDAAVPFATCELGGGMHVAYHRRPLVTERDVAALALAKIGSGSVWQGYYMYAGGTQRRGPHGTEQESHATGYPNDVPTRTYDFHAPVGEHGQVREHHHLLRLQHLWLREDGAALATMPSTVGGGGEDPEELRWAVRSDGRRGYVFLSTYQPAASPLPGQAGVQVAVELGGDRVVVPSVPVDLPAGVSVVWPLRLPLADGLVLRSATAALVTRVRDDEGEHEGEDGVGGEVVVLAATDGVPVELVVEGPLDPAAAAGVGTVRTEGDLTVLTLTAAPGPRTVVTLRPGLRLLVLDEASARRLYRLPFAGRERLVLSDVPVRAHRDALVLRVEHGHEHEGEGGRAAVAVLPPTAPLTSDRGGLRAVGDDGPWARWEVGGTGARTVRLLTDRTLAATAPPVRRGGPVDRLSAPQDWSGAARLPLDVPTAGFEDADRVLLRVAWTGDVARALVGGEVVSDHFWHGRVWDVDLTPWRGELAARGLTLEFLPWAARTGVRVDPSVRDVPDGVHLTSVDVVGVQRVEIGTADRGEAATRAARR